MLFKGHVSILNVSPAYGGAASDRQVIEKSDIPKKCDVGDSIMVDKGFDVEDLFIPSQVNVNIPTCFKKRNTMNEYTVTKDRQLQFRLCVSICVILGNALFHRKHE